jgi:hypothetical protein
MYTFYEGDPKRGQRFANAMALYARSPGFAVDHLVSGYDWAALGSGTVVDASRPLSLLLFCTTSRADKHG